jgi:hypothetical protein
MLEIRLGDFVMRDFRVHYRRMREFEVQAPREPR